MICVRLRAQKGEPLYTRSPAGAKAQWRTAASHSALSLTSRMSTPASSACCMPVLSCVPATRTTESAPRCSHAATQLAKAPKSLGACCHSSHTQSRPMAA